MKKKVGFWDIINKRIFFPPAIALVIFVFIGILFPENFGVAANAALDFVFKYFSWFLFPVALVMLGFCLWAGFSKYGNIRLGGPDAKPTMSKAVWFAIALTSGIGVGITFYGVYEPVLFSMTPPEFLSVAPMSEAAIFSAMQFTFLHWGLHPYAIYTTAGLIIVFMFYNGKQPFRCSSALYPLLGEKAYKGIGDAVDSLFVFAVIGGTATSLGLAVLLIARGLEYLYGIPSNAVSWLVILIAVAGVCILAAITPVSKGIAFIGNTNTILYIFVLIFAFVAVDPLKVTELLFSSIGEYFQNFIHLSLYLEPIARTGWISAWNVFYNAWWLACAPLVGLFFVKLAYGRTIREFVTVNLFAPVIFSFVWFGFLGGGSIIMDKFHGGTIGTLIEKIGSDMSLYAFFAQFPFSGLMNFIALVVVILSIITLVQAIMVAAAQMTCKSNDDTTGEIVPPKISVIFWGIAMLMIAYTLLISGGISALQTISVVCGLAVAIVFCFGIVAYVKSMHNLKEFDTYSNGDLSVYAKNEEIASAVENMQVQTSAYSDENGVQI
ncbi:Glycine betaine transporter OpuD [anaerobic digester metagenome]